jgi:excisionase family DNA binding protein
MDQTVATREFHTVSPSEMAAMVGVSEQTIRRAISAGRIRTVTINRAPRITLAEIRRITQIVEKNGGDDGE